MGWFSGKKVPQRARQEPRFTGATALRSQFFSTDVDRFFAGWDTDSRHIDWYLRDELPKLVARSRKLSRVGYGARYIALLQHNIVGDEGPIFQSQVMTADGRKLDDLANDAIETAFWDWSQKYCDIEGFCRLQDFLDRCVEGGGTSGEVLFEMHTGPKVNKYGFALRQIEVTQLDITKNEMRPDGGVIRCGVEYDSSGRRTWYHFRDTGFDVSTKMGRTWKVAARNIIHAFMSSEPGQSRGIPWMAPGLEKAKHVEKFQEAAIVRARSSASRVAVISTKPDQSDNPYRGDEEGDNGVEYDLTASGEVWDVGNRQVTQLDGNYPGEMYEPFMRVNLRGLASSWNVSYPALSGDLSDTSFSSGRTGVMDEREGYKKKQAWLINQILMKVGQVWLTNAYMMQAITIGRTRKTPLNRPLDDYLNFTFQGKRWDWVDPKKDMEAAEIAIRLKIKSRAEVIRESGRDPDSVFKEVDKEDVKFPQLAKPTGGTGDAAGSSDPQEN